MDKSMCVFDGKEHSDGSEVCDATRCMVCRDGEWLLTWISDFGL